MNGKMEAKVYRQGEEDEGNKNKTETKWNTSNHPKDYRIPLQTVRPTKWRGWSDKMGTFFFRIGRIQVNHGLFCRVVW